MLYGWTAEEKIERQNMQEIVTKDMEKEGEQCFFLIWTRELLYDRPRELYNSWREVEANHERFNGRSDCMCLLSRKKTNNCLLINAQLIENTCSYL